MSELQKDDPTMERLEDQISWYDKRSTSNKHWFKGLKSAEIGAATLIPFVAIVGASSAVMGGLGAAVAIMEGLHGLNQFQHNWISYRSTCEALKHEKHLFLAGAGPYADQEAPVAALAERVEALISREHAEWSTTALLAARRKGRHGGEAPRA